MPAIRIKLPTGEVTHVLSGERITVGRRPDNTIQILDRSVSGHHAELLAVNGHYRLHDLQSTNFSFVDGAQVLDYHLHGKCKVTFGSIECEYDPTVESPSTETMLTNAQLERDVAFLRAENVELLGKIDTLQRRIDILSSARLVTGRTDSTPGSAAADSIKAIAAERDDLRHQNTGLKLELDQLREELTLTVRERDTARQTLELVQAEKAALKTQIEGGDGKKGTRRLDRPAEQITVPVDPSSDTQRLSPASPVAPGAEGLGPQVNKIRAALDHLGATPNNPALRKEAGELAHLLVSSCSSLGEHAFAHLARALDDLLRDLQINPDPLKQSTLRTLQQAGDLLTRLLSPTLFDSAKSLPTAHVLAIDDDSDLLATVIASLQLAQVQADGCGTAEEGLQAVGSRTYDLVLVDVSLPGIDGTAFCAKTRDLPAYRKTPILFLTVTDTLDKRAETSLSGGSDFIGKPFNIFELALKVQSWVFKHQLGLL